MFLATREEMENKRINEVFGEEFLEQQLLAVLAHDVRLRGVALARWR